MVSSGASRGNLAQSERCALCDLLVAVGADHPTLCEGWTTAHLAAHLVIRERKPLAGPGIALGGPLARYTERVLERTRASVPYPDLVERVRTGPPALLRGADGLMNLVEYFVHHEDVRRASPGWEPRPGLDELERVLWAMQGRATKLQICHLRDVSLTLQLPDGQRKAIRRDGRPVTLAGPATEIVLYLFGRRDASRVELTGDPDAIAELRTGKLGM